MSGKKILDRLREALARARCPACEWHGMPVDNVQVCTGRAGCVRAAGTEGGATDGMGTRVVDWPGESEITRLRAENARLTATVAGLNETLDAANDMMADAATDAVRRIRSGEIAGFMASDVVVMSREQHDSDHEVVIRLRAEVERLTKERDEARHWQQDADREDEWTPLVMAAHPGVTGKNHEEYATAMRMIRTRHSKGALVSLVSWLLADRHARDIAVVKAALEAAAGSAKTIILAHPIGFGLRGMSAVVSDRDGAIADKVETSIRALLDKPAGEDGR